MVSVEDIEDDQKLVVKFGYGRDEDAPREIREARRPGLEASQVTKAAGLQSPPIFVMIGRPSRPPPATRSIVIISVFLVVWPSGDRTSSRSP